MKEKENLEKLIKKGIKYFELQDFENEILIWEKVCKIEPENLLFKSNLATAYYNFGKYPDALDLFNEVLEKNPTISRALHNRALLLIKIGIDPHLVREDLIVSLITSEDEEIYIRHFFNFCLNYSFLTKENIADYLEIFNNILNNPPTVRNDQINVSNIKEELTTIFNAFTEMHKFFQNISEKKISLAKINLKEATQRISNLPRPHYSKTIADYYNSRLSIFLFIFTSFQELSSLTTDIQEDKEIVKTTYSLYSSEYRPFDASFLELLTLYGYPFKLFELLLNQEDTSSEEIEFLKEDIVDFTEGKKSSIFISVKSATVFIAESILEFLNKTKDINVLKIIESEREKTWAKIKIHLNGIEFNYSGLSSDLARILTGKKIDPIDKISEDLLAFRYYIERQAFKDIYVNNNPQENIARALLQAFMSNRSYREVPSGAGKTDILTFINDAKILIETKIWRGKEYFEQGLREISEYYRVEKDDDKLCNPFYIIFDPTQNFVSKSYFGKSEIEYKHNDITIQIFLVHINPKYPSKS